MTRYQITSPWSDNDIVFDPFIIQSADLLDNRSKTTYPGGAMRVVVDGKPAVKGVGGTVPFKGALAWHRARSLASDLHNIEHRYVRTT